MGPGILQLEERVAAVAELVGRLRVEARTLERELTLCRRGEIGDATARRATSDEALVEEVRQLRAEREMVRERIRSLIKEIDQVSW